MDLQIDTKPLLRPAQLADARGERASLEKKLHNPHIQDKGEVAKQLKRLDQMLSAQTPKPFEGAAKDAAVKLEAELREELLQGMPSQEEMRKNPPGAVDKHMAWEHKNKQKLLQWKNLVLRLNHDNPDGSVANFEKYRPRGSTLNMDSAQIQGREYFMPPPGVAPAVVFSEEEMSLIRDLNPGLADKLALLTNTQRAEVKRVLQQG